MDNQQENQDIEILPDEESKNIDVSGRIGKLKEDQKKCHEERKEYLDGWQRAKADHINYKKDEGKRFEDMARFVTAGLIQDVLPVLDSFDLALQSYQQPYKAEPSGFRPTTHNQQPDERGMLLIRLQLLDVLKKRGLEVMNTEGQKFNPEFHESVGEVESDGEEGMIIEEIQKGYMLRGNVLRPTRVKISVKK